MASGLQSGHRLDNCQNWTEDIDSLRKGIAKKGEQACATRSNNEAAETTIEIRKSRDKAIPLSKCAPAQLRTLKRRRVTEAIRDVLSAVPVNTLG